LSTGTGMLLILDLAFISKDTGWICGDDSFAGGVYKTTNGGNNWFQQLNNTYLPSKIFFINKDTGWAICNSYSIYKTTNSGQNWNLKKTFNINLLDILFVGSDTGYISGLGDSCKLKTINGGETWMVMNYPIYGFEKMFFKTNRIGWAGSYSNKVTTIRDGINWGTQESPNWNNISVGGVKDFDTLKMWAGGIGMVHTEDGGGNITSIRNEENNINKIFYLSQNYPNPFNPTTMINYTLKQKCFVKLKVYDIVGKEIVTLVNENKTEGSHNIVFSTEKYNLTSGIYFYRLEITNSKGEYYSNTKKMLMVK
jgi:hypothetical protein